jgi:tetratricopeptide (TPR) repeat protein
MSGTNPLRAAQCRLREPGKTIPPAEIQSLVDDAKSFSPKLGVYAILTTAKVSTHSDRKILEINRNHFAQGLFQVELLNWDRIEQFLDEYPDIRDDLFQGIGGSQATRIEEQLTDIQILIKSTDREEAPDHFDVEIEEAKRNLEFHDYQMARLLLQRIRQQHWGQLSDRHKFRLISNLGFAYLGENDHTKAAECLFEARIYRPEDEKSLTNEVLAHFILGHRDQAFDLASRLKDRFSSSTRLASLWVQSAPPTSTRKDLEARLPDYLIYDAEVAVALSIRSLNESDFKNAEVVLRNIRTGKKEWSTIPWLLARAIVGSEVFSTVDGAGSTPSERRGRFEEAEKYFSRAVDLALAEKQPLAVAQFLRERADVRDMLGRQDDSKQDVQEAYRLAPTDEFVVGKVAEQFTKSGDLDSAIDLLRKLPGSSRRAEIQIQLAHALHGRGKAGDCTEAADLLLRLVRDPSIRVPLRLPILNIAIDCYAKDKKLKDAITLINNLPPDYLAPFASNLIHAQLEHAQDHREEAIRRSGVAISLVTDNIDPLALEILARLLSELGQHKEALRLWQKLIKPGVPGPDPRRLLDTAIRLRRHDVVLETCRSFRREGVENPSLLNYEVTVLEQYDPDAAIIVLKDHLAKWPADDVARVRLSLLGLRTDRKELVTRDISLLPKVDKVTPEGGAAVVQVLKFGGEPDAALMYAYELLRLNFDEPAAHRAYQFVLLPFGPSPKIEEHLTVGRDSAVSYVEEGTETIRTVVFEEPVQTSPQFHDSKPLNSALGRELNGKRLGDSFVLAPGNISSRKAKIAAILNKYVYRYQESMSEWQIRFPEESTMESIQVIKEPEGRIDISPILLSVDRQQESVKKIEEVYGSMAVPLHMLADRFGKNAFEGVHMVANRQGLALSCCTGTQDERAKALAAMEVCTGIVLDLSAIGTLSLLGIEDCLENIRVPLIISQATISELNEMVHREEMTKSKSGFMTKVDGQYAFIEDTPQEKQQRILNLRKLVDLLKSVAKVMPCMDLVTFEAERRESLYKAFGQYGTESILLAASEGRMLWTDDLPLAGVAAAEYGVRRIWTQIALEYGGERQRILPNDYFEASAKLLGYGYSFTSANPSILIAAVRLAQGTLNSWPLKQSLDVFRAPFVDMGELLRLAALFAVQLYREPLTPEMRDHIFIRVLDNLFEKQGSNVGAMALQRAIPKMFGVNVVGANQASECVKRWMNKPSIVLVTQPHRSNNDPDAD